VIETLQKFLKKIQEDDEIDDMEAKKFLNCLQEDDEIKA